MIKFKKSLKIPSQINNIMKIFQHIFDEIILGIKELSDKDFQRRVWLNIGNVNKIWFY
ncbi:MAG: hypothetical protein ABI315_07885 [Bacteroidia bacterium]